jgi:hypothetical protein
LKDNDSLLVSELINTLEFENLTMILDECANLDDIFSFINFIHEKNNDLSNNLMEYLFIIDISESEYTPIKLKEICIHYLEKNLDAISFTKAIEKLNLEPDERKIALILTDIAIINEEIAKRMLWELFSKFKEADPKRFVDSLKILKWASDDLFLVISIIGTEKLLQSRNLNDFNYLLSMFIGEDSDLIYPLVIEVPDSKFAIENLVNQSTLEDLINFLKIIEAYSPDYMDLLVNFDFESRALILKFEGGSLKEKLDFLHIIIDYEKSSVFEIFIQDNFEIIKKIIRDINSTVDLEIFYQALVLFNFIDKDLAQELLIKIDPVSVTKQLLHVENENLVINTFIEIASINHLYLYYSLQADFADFIKWLEFFILKLSDLETLALFLVSFHKIFGNAPELPLILTTIVKKLQREENLDDLGVFLGIIGNSEPKLLKLILNNLLTNLKLYPTDKIGYLLMATSLYNFDTGINLVRNLSSRFSSEYDIKLLRKSIESIILANAKVAELLLSDTNFNIQVLKNNIRQSDILEQVLFLETIQPVAQHIIDNILQDDLFIQEFFNAINETNYPELAKIISNSHWLNDFLIERFGKIIAEKTAVAPISDLISEPNLTLEDFFNLIHTSSWANRQLCKQIIYWTDITELGEKLEALPQKDGLIDKFINFISEFDVEKAEKLVFDYFHEEIN